MNPSRVPYRANIFALKKLGVTHILASGAVGSLRDDLKPRDLVVCMEGPQFSTRAESELHRSWGADLIGMTALPEAKLAREAEICYALVALVTDFDCWRSRREEVDQLRLLEEIPANLRTATDSALALLRAALPAEHRLRDSRCPCRSALALAIWSDKARIATAERQRLEPLIGRYL